MIVTQARSVRGKENVRWHGFSAVEIDGDR